MATTNTSHHGKRAVPVGPPIAPAVISRGPVFQPRFKNIQPGSFSWETPWAVVTVEGRLGGIHRKVLDAIFAEPIKSKQIESGAQMMVIDPYRIAKLTGATKSHPQWLKTVLRDMQNAHVTILDKATTGLHYWGHIISDIWESKKSAEMPGGALVGDRPLFVVTISPGWMQIYDTSLVVRYRNELSTLADIKSGAVHAAALHILTHSSGSFDVAEVLRVVGVGWDDISSRRQNQILQEVERDAEQLKKLGMHLYRQAVTAKLMISYQPTGEVHGEFAAVSGGMSGM